jgi:hypothetical protein
MTVRMKILAFLAIGVGGWLLVFDLQAVIGSYPEVGEILYNLLRVVGDILLLVVSSSWVKLHRLGRRGDDQ